jgi:plasmid stability protein
MAQVLVRNIADAAIRRLKKRAERKGTSLEGEVRSLIEREAGLDRPAFRERAREVRARLEGRRHADSTALVREDRDR